MFVVASAESLNEMGKRNIDTTIYASIFLDSEVMLSVDSEQAGRYRRSSKPDGFDQYACDKYCTAVNGKALGRCVKKETWNSTACGVGYACHCSEY